MGVEKIDLAKQGLGRDISIGLLSVFFGMSLGFITGGGLLIPPKVYFHSYFVLLSLSLIVSAVSAFMAMYGVRLFVKKDFSARVIVGVISSVIVLTSSSIILIWYLGRYTKILHPLWWFLGFSGK